MTRSKRESSAVPAIQIHGLTKHFGDFQALRGIDLEVKHGESLVIFGPNGAGKTTLIKILATILNPSSGSVTIDGLGLKDKAEEVRRRIGVITHQTFLYGNLTARENLEFYGRMYDVPALRERILEVAALVEMTARLDDRVSTLSRGMQQRISIARAMLHRPAVMLLDEPETGLDQQAMSMLWLVLRSGEGDHTIILTTHNLERGLELGERVLIMARGKIAYECPVRGLSLDGLKEAYEQCTRVQP